MQISKCNISLLSRLKLCGEKKVEFQDLSRLCGESDDFLDAQQTVWWIIRFSRWFVDCVVIHQTFQMLLRMCGESADFPDAQQTIWWIIRLCRCQANCVVNQQSFPLFSRLYGESADFTDAQQTVWWIGWFSRCSADYLVNQQTFQMPSKLCGKSDFSDAQQTEYLIRAILWWLSRISMGCRHIFFI